MGLLSIVPKLVKAAPKVFNYAVRGAKVAPTIIFEKGADVFVSNASKAARAAIKADKGWVTSAVEAFKGGGKAVEGSVAALKATKGSFFTRVWNEARSVIPTILGRTKAGAKAAKMAGKSGILGGAKGFFSGIGKKMPFLGNALLVAFELPNIITAIKEKGLVQGVKETVKAGGRLGGAAMGAAIGTAVAGPIGGFIGWIAGEWLGGKVFGKSYTEQKEEEEEKLAQETQVQDPYGTTNTNNPFVTNPYTTNFGQYYNSPLYDDISLDRYNYIA